MKCTYYIADAYGVAVGVAPADEDDFVREVDGWEHRGAVGGGEHVEVVRDEVTENEGLEGEYDEEFVARAPAWGVWWVVLVIVSFAVLALLACSCLFA